MPPSHSLYIFLFLLASATTILGYKSYADFVNPDYVVNGDYSPLTGAAQDTIVGYARELAAKGPWSVMDKVVTPPTGSKHDYMSWALYWWPDCSGVGNTTELTPEEVWKACLYLVKDGQINPDARLVNDIGAFENFTDAVFYNSLAWKIKGGSTNEYSKNAVSFINTWFLDPATQMNPNLEYGQMRRGRKGQKGSYTGVLDMRHMIKIANAILIFRKGKCSDWTDALDAKMISWSKEYMNWLETTPNGIDASKADNNHGSYYYNQYAALKLIVGDVSGAENAVNTFFDHQFMSQIEASGNQPLEAARVRSYHYIAFNIAAMIINARIAVYANPKSTVWNKTTTQGATIQTAVDFSMGLSADAANEAGAVADFYPNIAAIAATYGDQSGKYVKFLKRDFPTYDEAADFFWNQPLSGGKTSRDAKSVATNINKTKGEKPANEAGASAGAPRVCGGVAGVVLAIVVTMLLTV